jgi:hypothetical protein
MVFFDGGSKVVSKRHEKLLDEINLTRNPARSNANHNRRDRLDADPPAPAASGETYGIGRFVAYTFVTDSPHHKD